MARRQGGLAEMSMNHWYTADLLVCESPSVDQSMAYARAKSNRAHEAAVSLPAMATPIQNPFPGQGAGRGSGYFPAIVVEMSTGSPSPSTTASRTSPSNEKDGPTVYRMETRIRLPLGSHRGVPIRM